MLRLREATDADEAAGLVATEYYDMVVGGDVVGTIHLRLGDTEDIRLYAGHVGYGVESQYRGHGYASSALKELGAIAQRRGFAEIWITCEPDNIASCRTLENAGATFEGMIDVPIDSNLYARGLQLHRYRLLVCLPRST